MAGIIRAERDKDTPKQIRYKIEENNYGITGTLYIPKAKFKGKKEAPDALNIQVAFAKD